jgi:hypothetical protein
MIMYDEYSYIIIIYVIVFVFRKTLIVGQGQTFRSDHVIKYFATLFD